MTDVRSAERYQPRPMIPSIQAAVLAVIVTVLAVFGSFSLVRAMGGLGDGVTVSPAVLELGRQWELQRRQQSGWIDPVLESGREWERQRKQQSGYQ
jgi:hypothetical protein